MTRRLHALRVGNFKAFAETQRIPLKPITLIFGPNSAGKSSFIHSLALAHEAQFGREKRGRSGLDVYHTDVGGSAIDLGGFRQYVHRGQLSKRVEWGAELKVAALAAAKDQRLAQLLAPVDTVSVNIAFGIELDDQDRPKPGAEPRVDSIEIAGDGAELLRMSGRPSTGRADRSNSNLRLDRLASDHAVFKQLLKAIVETQTTSEEMRPEDFDSANEAIAQLLPELLIKVEKLFPTSIELPRADGAELSPANMLFPVSKGNRKDDVAQAVQFFLPRTLNDLIKGLADALADELGQLQYLGPLRSFPPRHLAFAEHEDANWYAGGGYAWDVVRRNDAVRKAVNKWLGSDKLKTPYRLVVRTLMALDQLQEPLASAIESLPKRPGDEVEVEYLQTEIESTRNEIVELEKQREGLSVLVDELQKMFQQESHERNKASISRDLYEGYSEIEKLRDEIEGKELHIDMLQAQLDEADGQIDHLARKLLGELSSSDADRILELVLIDQRTGTTVTHRDVGIGISQVLPVLVMAYGSIRKLLAMEQPEIHLHPALQAELGDVFIEAALGERQNTLILETHSEHLILRILRRIRETTAEQQPRNAIPVRPDDIAVLYVRPGKAGSEVIQIPVRSDGEFITDWPDGFFPERTEELF